MLGFVTATDIGTNRCLCFMGSRQAVTGRAQDLNLGTAKHLTYRTSMSYSVTFQPYTVFLFLMHYIALYLKY